MSTSSKDFIKPLNTTVAPAGSTKTPTDKPAEIPLDPSIQDWIHHLAEGMNIMATNEEERRKVAKKLF
jgi:hypothetical protein